MRHTHAPGTQRDTGRIETFSDGVFAIAMTLLILEIRMPQPPGPSEPVDLTKALQPEDRGGLPCRQSCIAGRQLDDGMLYASRGYRLIDRHLSREFVRRLTIQYLVTVALYAGAALVSLFSFRMGLAICIALTLLYLLPPKKPVYVHEAQAA
jgi:hypothetical protein